MPWVPPPPPPFGTPPPIQRRSVAAIHRCISVAPASAAAALSSLRRRMQLTADTQPCERRRLAVRSSRVQSFDCRYSADFSDDVKRDRTLQTEMLVCAGLEVKPRAGRLAASIFYNNNNNNNNPGDLYYLG